MSHVRPRDSDSPNVAALFEAANKLRGSVESAEYKHLVLGLLFLKYISDAFEQRRAQVEAELSDPAGDAGGSTRRWPLVLEQAKELYRYWPEVEDRLFA
ncbi:MAG: hypothetical protein DLM64_13670 [Solirubrobacterales bacterium]|nr:MAG: hypothetical protein DLM64_13670 [Solirubrobacterales bacterium]